MGSGSRIDAMRITDLSTQPLTHPQPSQTDPLPPRDQNRALPTQRAGRILPVYAAAEREGQRGASHLARAPQVEAAARHPPYIAAAAQQNAASRSGTRRAHCRRAIHKDELNWIRDLVLGA